MIADVTAAAAAGSTTTASSLGGMDSEAFLQLLVAQLRYQNPMEPSDPTAMLQQTAMFTQVESMQQIARSQAQLLGLQHAGIAADLVGKHITAPTADGGQAEGLVESVRFTASGPMLVVGEHLVPLDATQEISGGPSTAPETPPPGSETTTA